MRLIHALPCCSMLFLFCFFVFFAFLLFGAKFYDAAADPEVQLLVIQIPRNVLQHPTTIEIQLLQFALVRLSFALVSLEIVLHRIASHGARSWRPGDRSKVVA